MRYVHWIKINGYTSSNETAKQFHDIDTYIKKYPLSKAMLYQYDSGSFDWIVKLECAQCYDDLELDINSCSTQLRRLHSKPQKIGREKIFAFPESYRKYLV